MAIAADKSLPLYERAAGIFTYGQAAGVTESGIWLNWTSDKDVREFALRALADRKPNIAKVPTEPFLKAMEDGSPRVKIAAAVGLGRLGRPEAAQALFESKSPGLICGTGEKELKGHTLRPTRSDRHSAHRRACLWSCMRWMHV